MSEPEPISITSSGLSFKQRLILRVVPFVASNLIAFMYRTNRIEEYGREHWDELETNGQPFLFAAWHETIAITLPRFGLAEVHALTSMSFDGALISAVLERFGVKSIRGSSSRGGRQALAELVKHAPNVRAVAITIDGPRGPRRIAKRGMAALSQQSGLPVVPIASSATRSFRLRSWDRTCVPLPFGKFVYRIGKPIAPAESSDRECISEKSLEIQSRLNELHAELEAEYNIDPQP